MACGYLLRPAVEGGYRQMADVLGACPACADEAWLGLRDDQAMLALTENEAFSGTSRRGALRRWSGWATRTAGVFLVGGSALTACAVVLRRFIQLGAYNQWMVTVLAFFVGIVVFTMRLREIGLPPRVRGLPMRWRLALPSTQLPLVPDPMPAVSGQELVTAPLSGRPCVAYEIGVREDDDCDADMGTWLLLEQSTAALRIGEVDVPRDAARVRVPQRDSFKARNDEDRERMHRFLRERGFDGHSVRVFETVLPAGVDIAACTEDGVLVVERN